MLCGLSAGSPRGDACAGRAARDSEAVTTRCTSQCLRPGAVSVQRSLGQLRGVERVARWPRRQPRQVRNALRVSVDSRPISTRRSARGPHATGFGSIDYEVYIRLPPTWRGVGAEARRPTAWDGARRLLAAKTTTTSAPARACSVGVRPVSHRTKCARAARHGTQTLWQRNFEAASAVLVRCQ